MRKIALLIVLMMVFALTSYAEGGATVTVTGAIKAQWGMDIDNVTTGFKYVMDGLQVVMKPPVEASEAKRTGAEGETVYGEIKMGGLRLEADSGWNGMGDYSSAAVNAKWDELSAKLVLGPLTVQLKGGADTTINYEGAKTDGYWLTNAYDYAVFTKRYGSDDSTNSAAKANGWESWNQIQFATPGNWFNQPINYGVVLKYSIPDVADLGLDIASYTAWDEVKYEYAEDGTTIIGTLTDPYDGIANSDNAYAGRFCASITAVPNLTMAMGVNFAFGYDDDLDEAIAFGAKVGYTIDLGDGNKITPAVATDIQLATDALISVTGGIKAEVAKSTITANVGYDVNDEALAYTIAAVIGAIDGLTLNAAYEATDAETMAMHVKLGYGIKVDKATITPCFQLSMDDKGGDAGDNADDAVADDLDMFAKFQLEIAGAVPNTTFYLNWDSNDLNNTTANAEKMGQFVFTTKISF